MKTPSLALLVLLVLAGCQSQSGAVNQLRINDQVTLSGYPDARMVDALQQSNALVIDLRHPDEMSSDAPSLARSQLDHVNIPVGRSPLVSSVVAQVRTAIEQAGERPVLIHCASGNRAGLVWAASLIDNGRETESAISDVRKVATKPQTLDAIREYADRAR